MRLKNRCVLLAFIFVLIFAFSSCTAAVDTSAQKEKQENMLEILQEAKKDLTSVHTVLNDTELDLSNETKNDDTGKSAEENLKETEQMLAKIKNYQTDIQARITAGEKRVLDDAALEGFNKSELHCLKLLNDVLTEYESIGNYLKVLFKVSEVANSTDTLDSNNLGPWFENFSGVIKSIVDELNASKPPSFLQSFHTDLTETLNGLQSATQYLVSAISITDNLRIDAGMYRYTILMRDFGKALENAGTDIKRRIEKLKGDADSMKKTEQGLSDWVDKNIEKLDSVEGSETK